jgi:hypothetical protein
MPPKRRRPWIGFAVSAALAIAGLFVVHGAPAGAVLFAAFLAFLIACIHALRGYGRDAALDTKRTGVIGWFGNWL